MEENIPTTLTEEEFGKLKKNILNSITNEKFLLVVNYPFIGAIALHLDFVPIRDKRVPTACTDGSKIYFDVDFYISLTESERCFVLAHETWHCVMLHFLRKQTRQAELFNIATDMEVNNIIKSSADDASFHPPTHSLFPPPELGKDSSAEEIYEWLLKQAQKQPKNGNKGSKGGGGSNSNSNSQNNPWQSRSQSGGSGNRKLQGQWDKHTYKNEDNQSDNGNGEDTKDRWGKKGYDPDFQPQVQENVGEQMRERVIAEAQKIERQQGKLPSCLEKLVNNYRQPEIRWQEELARFVTVVYGGKRQWLPPNRRHVHEEIYLQSRRDERIRCTVAVDTSGSCMGDLPKFFGELISLMNTFGDYEIDVIYCDADIQKVDHFDRNTPFTKAEGFQWKGGGGTSFCPPFDYMKKHGIRPDCFIYFTDGYGDAPQKNPGFPVLWVLTSDGSRDFCSWGKKIRFKSDRYRQEQELDI